MGMTAVSLRELGLGDQCTSEEFAAAFGAMSAEIDATSRPFCRWPSPYKTPEAIALGKQIRGEIDAIMSSGSKK